MLDCQQHGAKIAEPTEQTVERSLVRDGAVEQGRAVLLLAHRQPSKPHRPAGGQMATNADAIPHVGRAHRHQLWRKRAAPGLLQKVDRSYEIKPRSRARATASVRRLTPSFPKMLLVCVFTVLSATTSDCAIS